MLQRLNRTLVSLTGFEFRRAEKPGAAPKVKRRGGKASKAGKPPQVAYRPPADPQIDRLLRRPVFIMAPVRSGSTLLRVLLNAHSRLHAPHELHFRRLEVALGTRLGEKSMDKLDLELGDLEHLLWDRVMQRELVKVGKDFIVEKTPSNAFAYQRLAAAWPDARFIFLLRHPASIAKSWHEADPKKRTADEAALDALRYMRAVERARANLTGHIVRYEDLTADPESTLKGICEFLGIDFEADMLEYGKSTSGDFTKGLGDWKDKIRSGNVQPGRELPSAEEIPESLREISAQWGYLGGEYLSTGTRRTAEPHAEVTEVWPKDGKIRVLGEIVGEPKGGTAREWRLRLVLHDHAETTVSVPVKLEDDHFDVSVSIDDLVPPEGIDDTWWDAYLVAGGDEGEVRLRVGRHLDDIENKRKIMVFPEQTVSRGDLPIPVKPAYTPDNDLCVEYGAPVMVELYASQDNEGEVPSRR